MSQSNCVYNQPDQILCSRNLTQLSISTIIIKAKLPTMEAFEAELAEATNPVTGDLLGAVAMVIDNKGERGCAMMRNKTWMRR